VITRSGFSPLAQVDSLGAFPESMQLPSDSVSAPAEAEASAQASVGGAVSEGDRKEMIGSNGGKSEASAGTTGQNELANPVEKSTGIQLAMSDIQQAKSTVSSFFKGLGSKIKSRVEAASRSQPSSEKLGLRYVTKRILVLAKGLPKKSTVTKSMFLPMDVKFEKKSTHERYMEEVARYLKAAHWQRFMVWNISDASYSTSPFDDQVISFSFPGQPTPPLEVLHQMCKSLESWLAAEAANVALIHCQSGRGRTFMTIAAYLHYTKAYPDTTSALLSLLDQKYAPTPVTMLVPTQRRYLGYYERYLKDGLPAKPRGLGLRKIVLHGIPAYGASQSDPKSCRPYLQVFQRGKLLHTTTGPGGEEKGEDGELTLQNVRVYDSKDEGMVFAVEQVVEGDVLVRVRHLRSLKKRITMLRYGFHTDYVGGVDTRSLGGDEEKSGSNNNNSNSSNDFCIKLCKQDLDVACTSERFESDFRMEMYFGEIKAQATSKPEEHNGEDSQASSTAKRQRNSTRDSVLTGIGDGEEQDDAEGTEEDNGDNDNGLDIEDLESRLHRVLEDIDSDDEEGNNSGNKVEGNRETVVLTPIGSLETESQLGHILGDDDGDKLLAALHAELEQED